MGMAASQARFLGLTARKNNVEYEGQQINQQRTTLSNQSANYYNNLLGMSVPVPPSVDDYTKTVYTFEDGALTNQITAMMAQPNGDYTVSYLRQWTDDFSVVSATTSIVNGGKSGPWKVGATELRQMGQSIPVKAKKPAIDDNGVTRDKDLYFKDGKYYSDAACTNEYTNTANVISYDYGDDYLNSLSSDQLTQLLKEEQEYIQLLKNKYGSDSEYMVRYIKNSTTGEYEPYFYKKLI